MKKRASILLALTAVITGVVCYPINALEAESPVTESTAISVEASNDRLEYGTLTPGNSYTKTLTLTNPGQSATTFALSIDSYQGAELDASHTAITEWLTLTGASTITLEAEAAANVNIRVRVPKDAPAGGQYASLIASNTNDDTLTLATISATVNGTDLKYGGEVSGTTVKWLSLSPQITSSADISNTGNVDFEAKYKFTVKSIFGGEPLHESETSQFVMPSATASLAQDWSDAPMIGLYNAIQTVTYVNENAELVEYTTERVIIICPIWLIILLGVVILGVVALIVILSVRRKKSPKPPKPNKKASWEIPEEA